MLYKVSVFSRCVIYVDLLDMRITNILHTIHNTIMAAMKHFHRVRESMHFFAICQKVNLFT